MLSKRIEVAYLPDAKNDLMDEVNLSALNEAYAFANKHRCRAFCTYLSLIPLIESKNYVTRLVPVIDFPSGYSLTPEEKVFDCGKAYEVCKKSSSSEVDIVLDPNYKGAIEDIKVITAAKVNEKIGVKYIIELCHRNMLEIIEIVDFISSKNAAKYIKTNTGKMGSIPFEQKLKAVEWLRSITTYPIKVSGGVDNSEQIEKYSEVAGPNTIFGVSHSKLKEWKEFK